MLNRPILLVRKATHPFLKNTKEPPPSKSQFSWSWRILSFKVFLERALVLPIEAQGSRKSLQHRMHITLCGRDRRGRRAGVSYSYKLVAATWFTWSPGISPSNSVTRVRGRSGDDTVTSLSVVVYENLRKSSRACPFKKF